MPKILIIEAIGTPKAKTVEHAFAIIQQVRSIGKPDEVLELDFSGISWVTSMFVDRLVKTLVAIYGDRFEKKVKVVGIEETNVMFNTLWESAVCKVLDTHAPFAGM